MIKHLFKLMWNRKRSTSLLLTEIFLSFLVLFGIFSMAYDKYSYLSEPVGFNYKNIWNVTLNWKAEDDETVQSKQKQLLASLKNFSEIESASLTSTNSAPYYSWHWNTSMKNPNEKSIITTLTSADDNLAKVLSLNIIEGRWFNKTDDASNGIPIVINKKFRDEYFGDEFVLEKSKLKKNEKSNVNYKIVGVIDRYKYKGEFSENEPLIVKRFNINYNQDDETAENEQNMFAKELRASNHEQLMLKVKPGTTVEFEEKLVKHIANLTNGWEANSTMVEEKRNAVIKDNLIQILFPSALAFFLILNVGFGLMGVLWYSINRRKSEIGLRRAVGASSKIIYEQIIGEALLLGTFAIVVGIVFAAQVPILQIFDAELIIYLISIATSSVFLYCLVTVCSFYPGLLASKIQPVDALHNE